MNIFLDVSREIVVEDVGDVGNVNASENIVTGRYPSLINYTRVSLAVQVPITRRWFTIGTYFNA